MKCSADRRSADRPASEASSLAACCCPCENRGAAKGKPTLSMLSIPHNRAALRTLSRIGIPNGAATLLALLIALPAAAHVHTSPAAIDVMPIKLYDGPTEFRFAR